MNFIPYNPSDSQWTNHFTKSTKTKNRDGLYVIKNKKQTGEGTLRIVSPTQAVVKRARQSLREYKRKTVGKKKRKKSRQGAGIKKKRKKTSAKRKGKGIKKKANRKRK